MSLMDWLSGKSMKAYAQQLADGIAKRYPPEMDDNPAFVVSAARLSRNLEEIFEKGREYSQAQKLGWLGKARLANHFRWRLTDMGYRKEFVEVAVEGLVVYLTRR